VAVPRGKSRSARRSGDVSLATVGRVSEALACNIGRDDLEATRGERFVDEAGTATGPEVAPAEGETDGGTNDRGTTPDGDHDRQ